MEALALELIKIKNPAGREWFDPPEVIQTCNRWLFQLRDANFHVPENPHLIITLVLDGALSENRAELQSGSQVQCRPNHNESRWSEIFYYAREIPKDRATLERFCDQMMEDSLSVFLDFQSNAEALAKVKNTIACSGTRTMTGVGQSKKIKNGLLGACVYLGGPSPYGGEAYLYTSDKEQEHLVMHKLCNFNEYPDIWVLLNKMIVKNDVLTVKADTRPRLGGWPNYLPDTFSIPMSKLLIDDGLELDMPPLIKKYMTDHERPF